MLCAQYERCSEVSEGFVKSRLLEDCEDDFVVRDVILYDRKLAHDFRDENERRNRGRAYFIGRAVNLDFADILL